MKIQANPYIEVLHPYLPGKSIEELKREHALVKVVKLASNENPLGSSPKAKAAIKNALDEVVRYPEGDCYALRAALATKLGFDQARFTFGNGSNDILDVIARAFLSPQSNAVFSHYAFAVYSIATQSVGAKLVRVDALSEDDEVMPLGHDLDGMLNAINDETKVVFIANPNNPTGTWLNKEDLYLFIKAVPEHVIVVLDEAYIEYVPDDLKGDFVNGLDWVEEFDNLIVTRTFSKIYGLAGLRVGYCVSSMNVADYLNRVRHPFNVNMLAQVAAEAALADDAFVQKSCTENEKGKQYLLSELANLDCTVLPSMGNFLCINFKQDCANINNALLKEGVIVRPVANYKMPHYLRVTIGTEDENSYFIKNLKKVLINAV
jgi:histidinol-phosphate aminotransferase